MWSVVAVVAATVMVAAGGDGVPGRAGGGRIADAGNPVALLLLSRLRFLLAETAGVAADVDATVECADNADGERRNTGDADTIVVVEGDRSWTWDANLPTGSTSEGGRWSTADAANGGVSASPVQSRAVSGMQSQSRSLSDIRRRLAAQTTTNERNNQQQTSLLVVVVGLCLSFVVVPPRVVWSSGFALLLPPLRMAHGSKRKNARAVGDCGPMDDRSMLRRARLGTDCRCTG